MEHPIFTLSTKPDLNARRYEHGNTWLEVTPSIKGLATVHDRDILIYCISQVMAALNEGRQVSRILRFKAIDLLIATNRKSDGRGYEQLKAAFDRLQSTQIITNITTNDIEEIDGFSLIDRFKIVREHRDGRMLEIEITLSDWIFNAIEANEVLTLNRDYFRLRKPLERRLYELARKHCGEQKEWSIKLETLHKKTGSHSTLKEFRRLISNIVKTDEKDNHMPDYAFRLEGNKLYATPKPEFLTVGQAANNNTSTLPPLPPSAYEDARQVAPNYDVYYLEDQFREWCADKPQPKNLKAAFVGFCKARHKAKPYP